MAIEKLSEFAKDGQKNTDDLNLTDGFSVSKKPARQWFNWLFNTLTTKINEIIDAEFIPKAEIVDNLTTNDATKPVSAKQAKKLQDEKFDKSALNNTLTSTSTTQAVTAAQAKVLNDQAFGIGQGWHNVTSSRNLGTKYRNTRNKPITISLYTNSAATSTKVLSLKIDEEEIARCDTNGNDDSTITQIISPNEDYEVSATGLVLGTSLFWKEKY